MQSLFSYSTLDTRLDKSTRTLYVTLNTPENLNVLNLEMLFEIESLLAWCTSHIEINSIFFNSSSKEFSTGLDKKTISSLQAPQLEKIFIKLQKIIFSMMQLPQTIIMDLGEGSELLGSEFSLGADIRIASDTTKISFNHLYYGLIPGAGGLNILSEIVGITHAKNWIQGASVISKDHLSSSGYIKEFYLNSNKHECITRLLTQINSCAPVQRIQSKLALFETMRSKIEAGILTDRKITKAALISEDWKKIKICETEDNDFMPAKSMSYAVKLSLVKSDDLHS